MYLVTVIIILLDFFKYIVLQNYINILLRVIVFLSAG